MSIDHVDVPAWLSSDALPFEPAPSAPSVDERLVEAVSGLAPGKALEMGCGEGQDSIWLARRGWTVTAVDADPDAVAAAREAAAQAGVTLALEWADLVTWRPASRFDLVVSTFSLPARGAGRSRMLETAAAAVAPGGMIVLTELDVALFRAGRMAEKHLVSVEELERHLDGFRITRSGTRMVRRRHGYEELLMPAAHVVATRRTDLRTL
jgi:trans-aconitate methyltransferase